MEQRKRTRKNPQDAAVVSRRNEIPADHARGGGGSGCRGGAAARMSSVPGYMRATISFSMKAARVALGGDVADSGAPQKRREPVRGKVALARAPGASKATCSSSVKAPASAAGRVCPYSYCSLKGHVHAPVVPLRSFLASERRLIKTQQSMKHKDVSPFHRANNGGVDGDNFFVGAGATVPTASSDAGCTDLSTEMDVMVGRQMDYATLDHRSCRDAEDKVMDPDVSVDGSCGFNDVISDGLAEFTTKSRGRREEIVEDEEALADQEAQDFGACKSDISELDANDEDCGGHASVESSMDDVSSAFDGMDFEDEGSDSTDAATSQRNKLILSRRRTPTKEAERIQTFNPRAPNFLPVHPDQDAEKVDLRHQLTDDRKSAEEWMVDYELRRTVNKLARIQKRKVGMLVQAFETVLPPVASEKSAQQDDDKKQGLGNRDGLFFENFTGAGATASTASSDAGCSDLSTEMDVMVGRQMDYATFGHRSYRNAEDTADVSVDGSCGSSDVISDGLAEFTTKSRGRGKEIVEDEEALADQEAQDFGACKSDISELDANDEDCGRHASVESSMDDISSAFGGMDFDDESSYSTDAATSQTNKLILSRRRTPTKEAERIRTFNPRALNFLPVQPDQDAEKVDLRHQLTDDRKSAEEWMIDYELRTTVNKLAPTRKRKVGMLVQAFETVLPSVASEEKSTQQDDDKKQGLGNRDDLFFEICP